MSVLRFYIWVDAGELVFGGQIIQISIDLP